MGKANRAKRILAGVLGLVLLLAVVLCALCIAAEADHDCTGEDCPVCATVHQCENLLHQLASVIAAAAAAAAVGMLFTSAAFRPFVLRRVTPVSGKVRLNN